MTGAWHTLETAPRDRKVWLFLPSSKVEFAADGRPTSVKPECVIAGWDHEQNAWMVGDGRSVYPSMWHDADIGGVMPDNPLLNP